MYEFLPLLTRKCQKPAVQQTAEEEEAPYL